MRRTRTMRETYELDELKLRYDNGILVDAVDFEVPEWVVTAVRAADVEDFIIESDGDGTTRFLLPNGSEIVSPVVGGTR
jgi:hypothetical protein